MAKQDCASECKKFDDAVKDADRWSSLDSVVVQMPKQVIKQGLSEYFLFTIEGREDIKDKEPKRLVALKVVDVPLESIYKLSDRSLPPPRRGGHMSSGARLHQVLPLQERQVAGRQRQREEALLDGESWPLAAAQRHRQALLRVQEQGPGLRRRHRDQVRAHRRPRGSQRRAGQGHYHPTPLEGPEDRQRRRPAVQTAGSTTSSCCTTT